MTQPVVDLIIPALNEEASISLVLNDLPKWVRTVYVVDNGSTDKTAEVALANGATIIEESQRGYGAACLAGMAAIEAQVNNGVNAPEIVAFLDADYSDHPEYLNDLVQPIVSGRSDFVLGSRLLGEREPGALPLQSYFGNIFACSLIRFLFGGRYKSKRLVQRSEQPKSPFRIGNALEPVRLAERFPGRLKRARRFCS